MRTVLSQGASLHKHCSTAVTAHFDPVYWGRGKVAMHSSILGQRAKCACSEGQWLKWKKAYFNAVKHHEWSSYSCDYSVIGSDTPCFSKGATDHSTLSEAHTLIFHPITLCNSCCQHREHKSYRIGRATGCALNSIIKTLPSCLL